MRKRNATLSLVLMMVITVMTQMLKLLKSSVVAGVFGAGNELDAYNLVNSIVTFVFGFASAGILTIVVPEYSNRRNRKIVDGFITTVYLILFVAIALMILFRFQILDAISNRDEVFVRTAASVLIVMLLSEILASISNVTVAHFQCEGYYNLPKIIAMLGQLVTVAALVLLDSLTIIQYAYVIAAGTIVNVLIDGVLAVKKGWRFHPTFRLLDETKTLIKNFWPVVVSTGVHNLSVIIDSMVVALLGTGMITLQSYSSQISVMANTVIVGNLLVYIYPKIAKNIKMEGYQPVFWKQTQLFHAVVCLMIAGFAAIGEDAVRLLFGHGAFTFEDCHVVYLGASVYMVGQQTNVLRNMMYRYFYAVGDTKIPAANSIIVSVANVVISLLLVKPLGMYGVILGTVLSSLIAVVIIMVQFGEKIGYQENPGVIFGRLLWNLALSGITVAVVLATQSALVLDSLILRILVFGVETVAIYAALQWFTNRKVVMAYKTL